MLELREAQKIVMEQVRPRPPESIALEEAAGRVLAEAVVADRDQPPCDVSAMDGYAVRSADARDAGALLQVQGEVFAGSLRPERAVGAGEAYRIMTGAAVPPGADAVVMVEYTEKVGEDGVRLDRSVSRGDHIRVQGEARRAGEILVEAGASLGAIEVGLLATAGRVRLAVGPRPRVAVLSTGDEVVPPDAAPAPHQIRNSNGPMLAALVTGAGGVPGPMMSSGDDLDDLRRAVREGLAADILVAIGGVSMGEADRVGDAFHLEGVERLFHKVATKPGKPLWFGRRGETLVFGLPGNPVSSLLCFLLYVGPAMRAMTGCTRPLPRTVPVRLAGSLKASRDRSTYHPVVLESVEDGWQARPPDYTGSGDLAALARADALAVVPAGGPSANPGDRVPVLLLG